MVSVADWASWPGSLFSKYPYLQNSICHNSICDKLGKLARLTFAMGRRNGLIQIWTIQRFRAAVSELENGLVQIRTEKVSE
jgi:hypothetical protein